MAGIQFDGGGALIFKACQIGIIKAKPMGSSGAENRSGLCAADTKVRRLRLFVQTRLSRFGGPALLGFYRLGVIGDDASPEQGQNGQGGDQPGSQATRGRLDGVLPQRIDDFKGHCRSFPRR